MSVPSEDTAGGTENKPGFEFPRTMKLSAWPASSAGPAITSVAQPGTERSSTWLLPVVPGIVRTIEPRVRIVVDVPDGMGPDDQLAEQRRRS